MSALDDWIMWLVGLLMIALLAIGVVGFGAFVWRDLNRTENIIELRADAWTCTASTTHIQNVLAGKVWVPQTITTCVQYSRQGGDQ